MFSPEMKRAELSKQGPRYVTKYIKFMVYAPVRFLSKGGRLASQQVVLLIRVKIKGGKYGRGRRLKGFYMKMLGVKGRTFFFKMQKRRPG